MSLKTLAIGIAVAAAIGLVATTVALTINTAYQRGFTAGSNQEKSERDARDMERAQATNRQLIALINHADRLQDSLSLQDARYLQEKTNAQTENQRLRLALRNGTVRLSIPTTPARCAADHEGPAAVGQPEQARTELDPETAEALVTITDDGDNAIRDLNACVDRYTTVMQAVNALRPSSAP